MTSNNNFSSDLAAGPFATQDALLNQSAFDIAIPRRRSSSYAIATSGQFIDNANGNYAGDLANPFDDARVYAGRGVTLNGAPTFSRFGAAISVGPEAAVPEHVRKRWNVENLPAPVEIVIPAYVEPTVSTFNRTIDVRQLPLNSAADVTQAFGDGGMPWVVHFTGGSLALPSDTVLRNLTIVVEQGDLNFNGDGHLLDNVTLIVKNGAVNLGDVRSVNSSVYADGIRMNQGARFSGKNFLMSDGGDVIFNGATETVGARDFVKVVAQGDIFLNAAADTRGEFWSGEDFFANQASTIVGKVRAKQNVTFNAPVRVISDVLQNSAFPLANQPAIAIIDTGFAGNNPDIDYRRVIPLGDRVGGDANPFLTIDEGNQHGTHTLGIIGATQNNGLGIDGVNGTAPIYVSRAVGSGQWAKSVVEFIDRYEVDGTQPHPIIYLGFDLTQRNANGTVTTRYELTLEERAALEYARQKGALIVVPAGNDGGVMSALGQAAQEFDNIVTVGAVDATGRAAYSSYGAGLTIMAPGGTVDQPIVSTVGDGLGTMAGTSVAGAYVAGYLGNIWAANPGLSYKQVIDILKATARDINLPGWDEETGSGIIDVNAAVELAQQTEPEIYDSPATILPESWTDEGLVLPLERATNWATNFDAWVVPTKGANVREAPTTQSRIIGTRAYKTNINFSRWTYGERVNDYATGEPDERWYYDAEAGGWIASAIVGGNAPGSTPLPPIDIIKPPGTGVVIDLNSPAYQNGRNNPFAYNWIGQCTWYAYGRMLETGLLPAGAKANGWFLGNAEAWRRDADRAGLPRNASPSGRGLVVWPPGVQGGHRQYGHVAFVEEVFADGRIRISESNWSGQKVSERFLTPAQYSGLVFIPLENVTANPKFPSPPATPGKQREYRVRSGETLSGIAQNELGNANRWREIKKADGATFTDDEAKKILAGQSIYLPITKPTKLSPPITTPETTKTDPKVLPDAASLSIFTNNSSSLLTSYRIGEAERPDIQHDNGFSNIPKESPNLGDYAIRTKWRTAAQITATFNPIKYLPDGAAAYLHYQDGKGKDFNFSYEKMIKDDDAAKAGFDAAIIDFQKATENIVMQMIAKDSAYGQIPLNFKITGAKILAQYPTTENWQKAVGGHSIWSSANVNVQPGANRLYSLKFTLHAEDKYNFDPGKTDIASGVSDSENGRLVVVGLADEYLQYSTIDRDVSWLEGNWSTSRISSTSRA
jgi:surface antigen